MKTIGFVASASRLNLKFLALLCGALACAAASVNAEGPESLLPPFAGKGYVFSKTAKKDHHIEGWLPVKWVDNSTWAAVNATYEQVQDSPAPGAAAVRVKIERIDDGHVQMTTFDGHSAYKKGVKYVISGWARSEHATPFWIGARQDEEPREFYDHLDIEPGPDWKKFEFVFTPEMDCTARIIFMMQHTGTVDLAGISVVER
jgi:hypothetical protein